MEQTRAGGEAEFLIVLADQADLSGANQFSNRVDKARYVVGQLRATAARTQQPVLEALKASGAPAQSFTVVNAVLTRGDRTLVESISARRDVRRIDGNPTFAQKLPAAIGSALPAPAAPATIQPGLSNVGAPLVWTMGYTGQGVVAGGQDTGYQWSHSALVRQYRGSNGTTTSHDYNWHDAIHSSTGPCPGNSPVPCDDDGHGTHTMGIFVGDDGAGMQIGMAPGAKWIGCRNMDQGNGTPATYLECFDFFLAPYPVGGLPSQGNPDLSPDVTNNSWGCPTSEGCNSGNWDTMRQAIAAHRAAGIMTVVSAGNSGSACGSVIDPPAIFDEAYGVGAFDAQTGAIAAFSSRGPVSVDGSYRPKPDLMAPGVSVLSSSGVQYVSLSGTSMAAPHVAGAVALLWSARPLLKGHIDFTEDVLNQSATHVNVTNTCSSNGWPNNVYGYGRLNVKAAVDAVPSGSATITGVITSGAPVSGALVSAVFQTASLSFPAITGADGIYTLTVVPGLYTVTASAGLVISTSSALQVSDGASARQDFALNDATAPYRTWLSVILR